MTAIQITVLICVPHNLGAKLFVINFPNKNMYSCNNYIVNNATVAKLISSAT